VLVANLLEVAVATTLTPTLASPAPPVAAAAPSGRIAYTYKNPKTDELDTALYNLATGTSWPIFAAKRQPDFNNQGDLVLNSEGGGVDALVLMRAPGELLGVASAFSEDGHPHWSPTNKSIVFDSALVGDGRHRLYLQRDDNYGQKVGPLMYDAWEIFGRYPIFLLDGRIAYNGCNVWENASTCGIYVVDTWGNQPQNLTNWPRDIPTDNLGSQILMMSDRAGDWNVYLVDPAGGAPRQLTDDPAADGLATASPDGNWIAFVSDRDGPWAVYAMQSDGSNLQKLFELEYGYGPGETWLQERLSWGW
jgi:Tol biopolymer transport system component